MRTLARIGLWLSGTAASVGLVSTVFFEVRLGKGPLLSPRFDFAGIIAALPGHFGWLLPFILLSALVIPFRAWQWKATLPRRVPFRERYHLVSIGAFVHNAVPGKLGDVFRALVMARTQSFPFVQALGSVAVCKLFELAALMLLVGASLLGPFALTMQRFSGAAKVALAACASLVLLVVLLARYSGRLSAWLSARGRTPKSASFLANVGVGLGTARSPAGLVRLLCLSVPPVLAPAFGYGLALRGVGVSGGLFAGAVMLGAIALGQVPVGLPVGTGVYYFIASWTARSLGASARDAAIFAVATHLSTVLTQTGVGLVSVLVRRLRWRDLRRGSGEGAAEAKLFGEGAGARA